MCLSPSIVSCSLTTHSRPCKSPLHVPPVQLGLSLNAHLPQCLSNPSWWTILPIPYICHPDEVLNAAGPSLWCEKTRSQRDMMSAVNISIWDPCSELPPILQPNLVSYIVEIKVGPVGSVAAWLRERSFKGRFGVTWPFYNYAISMQT